MTIQSSPNNQYHFHNMTLSLLSAQKALKVIQKSSDLLEMTSVALSQLLKLKLRLNNSLKKKSLVSQAWQKKLHESYETY